MIDARLLDPLPVSHPGVRRWIVAFSGGMDSSVLLHLAHGWRAERRQDMPELAAIHVDHGVQPASRDWALHCARVCEALGVPLAVVTLAPAADPRAHRSEEQLRRARYAAFETHCAPGDLLLLAHHRDDQAETVLMRLARGAGVDGLAGMPATRALGHAQLARPLLGTPRAALVDYAREAGLDWIEDPGNAAIDFDRNYLRRAVLPLLERRWPGAGARMAATAAHCAEAAATCGAVAAADLGACTDNDRFGQHRLLIARWLALPAPRQSAALRGWLQRGAGSVPGAAQLARVRAELVAARADADPELRFGALTLRRFRGALHLVGDLPAPPAAPLPVAIGAPLAVPGVGTVSLDPARAGGIRPGACMELRWRAPGVVVKAVGRPAKPLKQVLQEAQVPPWLRDRVPLLYVDGALAAVAGICTCAGAEAAEGEAGLAFGWQPPAGAA